MFRTKICGIRTPEIAEAAVAAGVDAIGLNFYRPSKRFASPAAAAAVVEAVAGRAIVVGLFVNHSVEEIASALAEVACDWIQLHGDEPNDFPAQIADRIQKPIPVLRALRIGRGDESRLADRLAEPLDQAIPPAAFLLDVDVAGYGGSGATLDWQALAKFRDGWPATPIVLAGGLTPENVAEAIEEIRPDAVDVASGVESAPGTKDAARMEAFCQAARSAFGRV